MKSSLIITSIFLTAMLPLRATAEYNPIERVSIATGGSEANGSSNASNISSSADGRYVVFQSEASDLVAGDTNGASDIFVYDRTTDTVERVSIATGGSQAEGASANPSISNDGRYVAFESDASDLVAGDNNDATDIFVYDRTGDTCERVSVATGGAQAGANSTSARISGDGLFVVFQSDADDLIAGDTNSSTDIFLRDLTADTTERVSITSGELELSGNSTHPDISDDGSLIVFQSGADDVVAGDTNSATDIFLRDTGATDTDRVNVADGSGIEADDASFSPRISGDGSIVAFVSSATNLVAGDNNGAEDVFIRDIGGGTTDRVSLASNGVEGNGASSSPSLSTDGRYIAFSSLASNITADDTNGTSDVFVHDSMTGDTARVSIRTDGGVANGSSVEPSINSNANFVSFTSDATTFIDGDDNDAFDIYVTNTQCSVAPAGVVPLDQDSDATDDCNDDCPEDAAKTTEGVCGCGVSDDDTDLDGTEDCNDECPTDAAKTEAGTCGCGVADDDSNGNGVADCLDPTAMTVPDRPTVALVQRGSGKRVRVIISPLTGIRAQVQIYRKGQVRAQKNIKAGRRSVNFRKNRRGIARYRYYLPGNAGFSQLSPGRRYNFKRR